MSVVSNFRIFRIFLESGIIIYLLSIITLLESIIIPPALIILPLSCFKAVGKSPHLKGRTWSCDLIQELSKLHCFNLIVVRGNARYKSPSPQRNKYLVGEARHMWLKKQLTHEVIKYLMLAFKYVP